MPPGPRRAGLPQKRRAPGGARGAPAGASESKSLDRVHVTSLERRSDETTLGWGWSGGGRGAHSGARPAGPRREGDDDGPPATRSPLEASDGRDEKAESEIQREASARPPPPPPPQRRGRGDRPLPGGGHKARSDPRGRAVGHEAGRKGRSGERRGAEGA